MQLLNSETQDDNWYNCSPIMLFTPSSEAQLGGASIISWHDVQFLINLD